MSDNEQPKWQQVSSRLVYENPWIRFNEDHVIRPSGVSGIYGYVAAKPVVAVLALYADDTIRMIGQSRYPVSEYAWEIVGGAVDGEETPLEAARRELVEEGGLQARTWTQLGPAVHPASSYSSEASTLYLAEDLVEVATRPDETELLRLRRIPFADALANARRGEYRDVLTIIALERTAQLLLLRRTQT